MVSDLLVFLFIERLFLGLTESYDDILLKVIRGIICTGKSHLYIECIIISHFSFWFLLNLKPVQELLEFLSINLPSFPNNRLLAAS